MSVRYSEQAKINSQIFMKTKKRIYLWPLKKKVEGILSRITNDLNEDEKHVIIYFDLEYLWPFFSTF